MRLSHPFAAQVLESRIRFRHMDREMRASDRWRPPFYEAKPNESTHLHSEVHGSVVLVVGYGRIGRAVASRAAQGCEILNFQGSYLGQSPLVSAHFWTSDHLSSSIRRVNAFSDRIDRQTLELK